MIDMVTEHKQIQSIMKTEIKKILYKFLQDGITSDDAAQQILNLFDVSGSLSLQTKLEMFYDFLFERGIAEQFGGGIDTIVKQFIDEWLLGNDR